MRGLHLADGRFTFEEALPAPQPGPGETRVRVRLAGVCATDLALADGYMGFRGVAGHEFVGTALDGPLIGRRVVGDINAGCGVCADCLAGDPRHCRERTVLGILGRSGAFAEELCLPTSNLHALPDAVSDQQAVFVEPLAAAFRVLDAIDANSVSRALVIGDGRLGLLCAQVLLDAGLEVDLAGRHPERVELFERRPRFLAGLFELDAPAPPEQWDMVVEATGHPRLLEGALAAVEARGTVVLKTTGAASADPDFAPLVIKEVRLVGSRCGAFAPAIAALADGRIRPEGMIDARYPLARGPEALDHAARPGALKILIEMPAPETR